MDFKDPKWFMGGSFRQRRDGEDISQAADIPLWLRLHVCGEERTVRLGGREPAPTRAKLR